MMAWIQAYEPWLWSLAAASAVLFLASLVVVPMVIVRLPHDYFAGRRREQQAWLTQRPLLRAVAVVAKTALGAVLVLAGIAMLVLPGQGVVTILVGITLMSFPGKYRLERWIISRRPVRVFFNWLRRRAGKRPLLIDRSRPN
jgi:hypothetical protein